MATVVWILLGGIAMAAIALGGAFTLIVSEAALERLMPALVALAAGSLLGGALFHLMPEAVAQRDNELGVYTALAAGFVTFFVLEQFLHWQHSHRASQREPVGYLVLVADSLHNLLDGVAVGAAFVTDTRLGVVAWLVTAAHELPQELGDFAVLVSAGWRRRTALVVNVATGLLFLAGSLLAYGLSAVSDISLLLPLAAGGFLYIAAADLVPQLRADRLTIELAQFAAFLAGLGTLLALAAVE